MDAILETIFGVLEASWAVLGPSRGRLGGLLGRHGAILEASWAILEASWNIRHHREAIPPLPERNASGTGGGKPARGREDGIPPYLPTRVWGTGIALPFQYPISMWISRV